MTDWFQALLDDSGFLDRWPHHTGTLAACTVVAATDADDIPVMAVGVDRPLAPGLRLRLYVNRGWFERHPEHFAGCLLHELHHAVYGHLTDERLHAVDLPEWMEVAMELGANEDISVPLPAGFHWQDFAEFGISARQSTMERYGALVEAQRQGKLQLMDEHELDARDPGWRDRVSKDGTGQRVVVWPSAPKRRVLNGRVIDQHHPAHCQGGAPGLGDRLMEQAGRRWSRTLGEPTSGDWLDLYRDRLRTHLGHARGGGDSDRGGHRASEATRAITRADGTLDWAALLRRIVGERAPAPSWRRPPRRFPERLGEVPGRSRRASRPRVLAVLDTSGSMTAAALARGSAELARLSHVGAVTVAEVDARVHRTYAARPLTEVVGGGDTDFRPAFELLRAGRWDVVVYVTDGRGPWPAVPPAIPVVWALVGRTPFSCPWGTVVVLPGG